MTLQEVKTILEAKVLCEEQHLGNEVLSAFACDFMSDVLAYAHNQPLLLTGLVNPQVIRTAEMMDVPCIVFVRGKLPDEAMLELAAERGIVLMSTQKTLYLSSCLLFTNGLQGG